eukprot:8865313-Pyramimonas_sp.AAC.1
MHPHTTLNDCLSPGRPVDGGGEYATPLAEVRKCFAGAMYMTQIRARQYRNTGHIDSDAISAIGWSRCDGR